MRPLPHALSFTQRVISSFLCNEEGKYDVVLHIVAHQMLFFPLISTQGRENDQQTHTHTGGEDEWIELLVTSTFSMDSCGFDLINVTGLYVYCQSKHSANSRSPRPSEDPAAETEFTPQWWSDDLQSTSLIFDFPQMHCCSIVLLFIYYIYIIVLINILNYHFIFCLFFVILVCLVILCVVFMYIYVKKCFYNFCCALFIVLLFCFLFIYTFVYILLVVIFVILNTFVFLIIFLCIQFWFVF